jgi:phosphatidate cytidylyltransferase
LIASLVLAAAVVLAAQSFRREPEDFRHIIPSVAANLTVALYPGLFVAHIVLLSTLANPTAILLTFMATAYLNDTAAYVGGRLFGTAERPLLPISPNKTPVGFAFGFVTSIVVVLVAASVSPLLFPAGIGTLILFGAVCGSVVILGDLVESALKRSAAAKDSGTLIPGRGGILDSIDSPIFLAPVFYYLYQVLFS